MLLCPDNFAVTSLMVAVVTICLDNHFHGRLLEPQMSVQLLLCFKLQVACHAYTLRPLTGPCELKQAPMSYVY